MIIIECILDWFIHHVNCYCSVVLAVYILLQVSECLFMRCFFYALSLSTLIDILIWKNSIYW